MAYNYSRNLHMLAGGFATGSLTAYALDGAFVYETSGKALMFRFVSPVSQTNGALTTYVWCTADTGVPSDVRIALYNGAEAGEDPDRPDAGGVALATSAAISFDGLASTWVTMSIASCTLVAGQTYYLLVDNRTATPVSNYPTIAYRAAFDLTPATSTSLVIGGYTAVGFTTDPTIIAGFPSFVVKFADGSLLGNPYVTAATVHASNTNNRGNRFQFDEDVIVSGAKWGGGATTISGFRIDTAAGANLMTAACDEYGRNKACCRWPPVTLSGGVAYDCVVTVSSATATTYAYGMGVAEGSVPADVLACRWNGNGAYVDGATPGSYTVDTSFWMPMCLVIDSNPAIAGGGSGAPGNMQGGLQ